MAAYVEQLRRSEKRVNLIEGSLQIGRLLLSNDQAHRRGLTSFLDLASGVVLLRILHVFLPYQFLAVLKVFTHAPQSWFSTLCPIVDLQLFRCRTPL